MTAAEQQYNNTAIYMVSSHSPLPPPLGFIITWANNPPPHTAAQFISYPHEMLAHELSTGSQRKTSKC